jgi:hypothetical protein
MKLFYILIISLVITGCSNEPSITQKDKIVHKHIQSNKQEAKIAQEEYNKIKNQRINT